jgi:diguanylate cyclase (GGDEF)-like protein
MSNHSLPREPRSRRYLFLLWPVIGLAACISIWIEVIDRRNTEFARADALVLKEAATYVQAYEQYITRSAAQIDQITMQIKHSWEHSANRSLLEDMKKNGMFTDAAFVSVSILGRDGHVLSAAQPGQGDGFDSARFFTQHRDNISSALRIGLAPPELAYGRQAVLFSRRLDTSDDEFDGVVALAIDAAYFTAFASDATLGSAGVLAMADVENLLRVEQRGAERATAGATASLLPAAGNWNSVHGARLLEGEDGFADGHARVLGWRRSNAYPLVALVALSHEDALAGARNYWRESRNSAVVGSVFLALLSALAAALTLWARARSREQDEVRRAYRTATESANDGFYMAAPVRDRKGQIVDFKIVDCNERGAFFYGLTRTALIGERVSQLDIGVPREEMLDTYRKAMAAGFFEEDRRMPADARLNLSWGHRRLVRVGNGLAVTLQDISERKAHELQLQRMANEDSLTGLPNRNWFFDAAPGALARAQRGGKQLALLFIDLDEFKQVNDSHGHACGDLLLNVASQRLQGLLRGTDQVVRFGGDEFVVLLDPCQSERQVAAVAERIVEAFAAPFSIGDELVAVVGASVGISMYPQDGADIAALVRSSDIAMYAAKSAGKSQYRFFDQTLAGSLERRARLKRHLLDAIDKDQFVLHYQPRVDAHTGRLLSMEALLRWPHPELGMVPPLEFIPLAEASGLIAPLGALVIDKACAQVAHWRAQGAEVVPVSINVSPRQFMRGSVKRQLNAALARHSVPPSLIEMEITESAMMGDHDEVRDELAAIRAMGVKLHVDDFGTGYSSLSQLQRLRMDVLKVDRSFTAELGKSKEGELFFQAIVSMAHALGMGVVAEGVETAEQLAILRELGCNEVQGYFVARPMPAEAMAELMAKRFIFQ